MAALPVGRTFPMPPCRTRTVGGRELTPGRRWTFSLERSIIRTLFAGRAIDPVEEVYLPSWRWYDPSTTHVTQPDSVVPDPSNPTDSACWFRQMGPRRQGGRRFVEALSHFGTEEGIRTPMPSSGDGF